MLSDIPEQGYKVLHSRTTDTYKALGIDYLNFNPSTASHAVIRSDYHSYTQHRYKNLPSPYKVNLQTRLKYARDLAD